MDNNKINKINNKKFSEVFKKINFSQTVLDVFGDCEVESIYMNEPQALLCLRSDKIINENYAEALLSELKFGAELQVAFNIEGTPQEKIKSLWENVLYKISRKNPVCRGALENAELEFESERLTIKSPASFLLQKNKTDLFIKNLIKNYLNKDIAVEIISAPPTQFKPVIFENIPPAAKTETPRAIVKIERQRPPKTQNIAAIPIKEINFGDTVIRGKIFSVDIIKTKTGGEILVMEITDKTDSITVKYFAQKSAPAVEPGMCVAVKGKASLDKFTKEKNISAKQIFAVDEEKGREDAAPEKRVELHAHTKMSSMDGVSSAADLITRAAQWGHAAIAITDHGVAQAFPEALKTSKGKDIKIIYGVEAYLTDDQNAVADGIADETPLDSDYVVFDVETTGLSPQSDKIIEIGAVKISGGKITETYSSYINPKMLLPKKITEITGITDDDLKNERDAEIVVPEFLKFIDGDIIVAHNANFDMGFLRAAAAPREVPNAVIDTLELSRAVLPDLKRHRLNDLTAYYKVELINHHRATDDARATAEIFLRMLDALKEIDCNLSEVNSLIKKSGNVRVLLEKTQSYHIILLAKNRTGLRNLYELISLSHLKYFYKRPRIPRSELIRLREGLVVGSACEAGEFYQAVLNKKPRRAIKKLAEFYDYLEIQPIENNMFLLRNQTVKSIDDLKEINKKIVGYGEEFNKPVVATCDVHFLDPEDAIFRKVISHAENHADADLQPPLFLRTTDEMIAAFNYLGEEKAREVVIKNTNIIAAQIEKIKPVPDGTFPPKIEGAEIEIKEISYAAAKKLYGEPLPAIVEDRLERELNSIIKNGFSVMYIIAQKLVKKSLENGYLVGSRGSVGSSFVATTLEITEVNPLRAHYLCPNCKYSDFDSPTVTEFIKNSPGASGCDMPDAFCPHCGSPLNKDGHDIPFETFLGFDGDKEPDIDLNFSGEFQSAAHAYTEELFGAENVFKAGTISGLAEKTAYGFVRKYFDDRNINAHSAEINRIKKGCEGIKRTTGQHPGGLIILPEGLSIYDFTPVQRPANDSKSSVTTTHFDYHSIEGRLLKLDLLGHDVPTIIRYLHDSSGVDPRDVNLSDPKVISLFSSPQALGNIDCKTGTLGLPEFGTPFVRQMLIDTNPSSFSDLVRISGLSHGTDVWFNNAQDLIKNGVATLKDVIPTRDDIMVYLINKGVESLKAFKIMESVRKGRGLSEDDEKALRANSVPEWYIDSCKKIKYMFPKGHAVAYVMMTARIGYFKIYYPYCFYGATFSVRVEDFDYETMCRGIETARAELERIGLLGKNASQKEKNNHSTLELVIEMYSRGLKFLPLDLYKSDAKKFIVTKDGLLPPLLSIPGLGENVAESIVNARDDGEFLTITDFKQRSKATKNVIELLTRLDVFKNLPETDQLTFF